MKLVEASASIVRGVPYVDMLKQVEECGRVCYKSEDKITDNSAVSFVRNIIARSHEAVLEHGSVTVKFVCDRGVSHEIVRHRLAAYCQESTRYCNYSKEKFDNQVAFVTPTQFLGLDATDVKENQNYNIWKKHMQSCEYAYLDMLDNGCTPQQARAVLPNSLKTEIVMTANIREWRHFFKLRCNKAAHPDMVYVACKALSEMYLEYPVFFEDIYMEVFSPVQGGATN